MSMVDLDPKKAIRVLVGKSIREVEMMLIEATLEKVGGNRVKAAGVLKVTDRTLRNKLNPKREKGIAGNAEAVTFTENIQPTNAANENNGVEIISSNPEKPFNAIP